LRTATTTADAMSLVSPPPGACEVCGRESCEGTHAVDPDEYPDAIYLTEEGYAKVMDLILNPRPPTQAMIDMFKRSLPRSD
jgi:hypothetical protein